MYVPRESSIISTQFFVLNVGAWSGVLFHKLIIFLIAVILDNNLKDIYLSFRFFLSKHVFYLLSTASELFCGELFETFLSTSVANCLTWSKSSWLYIFMAYVFTYIFTNIVSHTLSKRQTSIAFYKYCISRSNWRASQFYILHFI